MTIFSLQNEMHLVQPFKTRSTTQGCLITVPPPHNTAKFPKTSNSPPLNIERNVIEQLKHDQIENLGV